jgi:hypothetical protein
MKIFFLYPIFFLSVQTSFGQGTYYGFYINANKDTSYAMFEIIGDFQINKLENLVTVTDCGKSSVPVKEINFIHIQNIGTFERKSAEMGEYRLDNQFTEVLIRGKASLYYYFFTNDEKYIIETEQDGMILLSNKAKLIQKNGTLYKEDRPFSHTVAYLLRDCTKIKKQLYRINYDHPSLRFILGQYNKCVGSEDMLVNKPELKSIAEFGPVVSYGISGFNYSDVDKVGVRIDEIKFKSEFDISAGLYFNIHPFQSNRKYSIGISVVYHAVNFKSVGEYFSEGTIIRKISDVEISFSEAWLIPSITRYFPISDRSGITGDFGFNICLPLDKSRVMSSRSEVMVPGGEAISINSNVTHNSGYHLRAEIGYQIHTGKYNNLSVILQLSYGTITLISQPNPINRVGIGLKYDLF